MNGLEDLVADFLEEAHEEIDTLETRVLALEGGTDSDNVDSIFRTLHTIKGTSGFFEFKNLESLAHVAENVLSLVRTSELTVTSEIVSVLLSTNDALNSTLDAIAQQGNDTTQSFPDLVASLQRIVDSDRESPAPAPAPADSESDPKATLPVENRPASSTDRASIRVGVDTLDSLMNLVGELVLNRNQIMQSEMIGRDANLRTTAQQLSLITSELQSSVMQTRMQPMEMIWNGLHRVVRDLAQTLDKDIVLELEGKETEVDKTIIEAIKDPLTHIIRNSVDHGIELPAARRAAGKIERGTISLRAFHEGGRVNIEIEDDGGGIDAERVCAIALERGVITPAQASKLTESECHALIFAPGFSTAEQVTNISGRGVGMDVVKSNIERIGGHVEIKSSLGVGTTIQIKIPLTLAIIPALMVSSADERFAIPQANLMELVRVGERSKDKRIEYVRGAPVLRLRNRLLPLVALRGALNQAPADQSDGHVVVLQANGRTFGLVVDAIRDTLDIVVKPLGPQLNSTALFSGATILGDGSVSLIVDVVGLSQKAQMPSHAAEALAAVGSDGDQVQGGDFSQETLVVVFALGDGRQLAAPLTLIHRLEMVESRRLERTGHGVVLQYHGRIVPVFALEGDTSPVHEDQSRHLDLPLLVQEREGSLCAIAVDRIIDIASVHIPEANGLAAPSLVIADRITEISDLRPARMVTA